VEHGSERGSCLAVDPLKRIHQDVVAGEACIYKQLGGMSVGWRALVAPQMQEPALFCALAANAILVSPNFMIPIALDISVSATTFASLLHHFVSFAQSITGALLNMWLEQSLKT
jgi:hypothetical protein